MALAVTTTVYCATAISTIVALMIPHAAAPDSIVAKPDNVQRTGLITCGLAPTYTMTVSSGVSLCMEQYDPMFRRDVATCRGTSKPVRVGGVRGYKKICSYGRYGPDRLIAIRRLLQPYAPTSLHAIKLLCEYM
mmetsp:Transcript_19075/g.42399  ORF Transcript_19075/g.42399 Transcript_19075/m.42399 type:complete len:134 (+) Transcript_19075:770-1171(+)